MFFQRFSPAHMSFVQLDQVQHGRMSRWNDTIWLAPPFFFSPSMVSMATVSSDWGQGSNWPIVSKLHFSEWFPLSCYWNRAPALWWIHLVIHSLEGKREKYKHDTGGLVLLKQRGYWMNKQTNTPTLALQLWEGCYFAWSGYISCSVVALLKKNAQWNERTHEVLFPLPAVH